MEEEGDMEGITLACTGEVLAEEEGVAGSHTGLPSVHMRESMRGAEEGTDISVLEGV